MHDCITSDAQRFGDRVIKNLLFKHGNDFYIKCKTIFLVKIKSFNFENSFEKTTTIFPYFNKNLFSQMTISRIFFACVSIYFLGGCVISPPTISYKSSEYVTIRQTNLGNNPALTPHVIDTANNYCKKIGKIAVNTGVVRDSGIGPEEFDFKCVTPNLADTASKADVLNESDFKGQQDAAVNLKPKSIKRAEARDAVAIIIGIADYKNLPRADYANDDARVFYDYAIRAIGVKPENIRLLVDADADEVGIYRAFKTWLPSRVRASTDVYVYYSGHGLPTADGQGLYVLPQRADRDFMDKTAITQAEINAAIQAAKPKSVTIFLDACYSGQARTGETLLASARPVSLKAETAAFPDGFTVITASRGDQISSSSPELKHGIFSYYLMRGMEGDADANRDGRITAGEMQAYLAENVSRQAGMMNRRQEPQLIGDSNKVLVGR